jgi:UDP-2,3-diacylglucosamine pyrophosphatase LpxH
MTTRVFVVSDLHLGGNDAFQMCDRRGQARLAEFFGWVAGQAGAGPRVELVLAGDVVDFLAEENIDGTWSAFTADEDSALQKLARILEDTRPVWDNLAACVKRGVLLTVMVGNHDIELSFPRVRRHLRDRLGPGSVELLCDNEAFTRGRLLVEHGNRYDPWNVVDHDELRRFRSHLSRREPAGEYNAQPGSVLVAQLMNRIKAQHPWVDLLKPETSGVVPILAALNVPLWNKLGPGIHLAARAAWRGTQYEANQMPSTDGFVAETVGVRSPSSSRGQLPDEDVFDWLRERGAADASSFVSEAGVNVDLVFAALRKWGEKDNRTFAVEREDPRYLRAATTLASRGYDTVVFGHTHSVKRIPLDGPTGGTYLNTGSWADLIRVPEGIFTSDAPRSHFDAFLDDLKNGRIARLRRLLPTFARIDLDDDDGRVTQSNVHFFDSATSVKPVDTEGVLERLRAE